MMEVIAALAAKREEHQEQPEEQEEEEEWPRIWKFLAAASHPAGVAVGRFASELSPDASLDRRAYAQQQYK